MREAKKKKVISYKKRLIKEKEEEKIPRPEFEKAVKEIAENIRSRIKKNPFVEEKGRTVGGSLRLPKLRTNNLSTNFYEPKELINQITDKS